jgi:acyl-CoA synthetase (AMP-forming)/AMP-acid ligase II
VNLADFLQATAARHAPRPAVTDVRSGRTLTYGGLAREADRVAAFLTARGVRPGQRIALLAPNSLAHLPAAFGLLATGACLVPLAPNLTEVETARVLTDVDVNGCLSWPRATGVPGAAEYARLDTGECEGFGFAWIDREAAPPAGLPALDPAFIRFTSGTTASSKGVVLSHAATAARVEAADAVLRLTTEDRILWVLPLAYHFAVTVVAYVRAGAHVLMCPDTLPRSVAAAIRRFEATIFYASPLHFERLASLGPAAPLASLRVTLSTSAPITAAVMERFESAYAVPVGQAYGLIEAGLPCINLRDGDLPMTSVGRPVPGYEIAILSADGAALPSGVSGEVAVRGAGLFSAYYAPWQTREQVARDGWFRTGDVGCVDAAGALTLEGRTKAVIFVAGVKFFPEEVEECLGRFPGVVEARVWGDPHPRLGQVPRAEIALAPGGCDLDGLRAHCARTLSPYKVPVDVAVVPAVARTPGGKILRR